MSRHRPTSFLHALKVWFRLQGLRPKDPEDLQSLPELFLGEPSLSPDTTVDDIYILHALPYKDPKLWGLCYIPHYP